MNSYYFHFPSSLLNIESVNINFSVPSDAPFTSLILFLIEVKSTGKKLEHASSVYSMIPQTLYALATNSLQKNALPSSIILALSLPYSEVID